ncbi:hypothetical protein M3Y99_00247900 [Aphelenchoides fujianensis]|nr:hypothetical protein M3Y99_00247900 [Aphelenchoides fujianensis]
MADDEEQARASDRSADENAENEEARGRGESRVEYELPFYNKMRNWTKFFYNTSTIVRYSRDGRYAYCFSDDLSELLIVDFVRHAQLRLKPKSAFGGIVEEFVLVNPTAMIAIGERGETFHDERGLSLLRMDVEGESFETIKLAEHEAVPTYVLTEITGKDVDVKHAVIHKQWTSRTICFCRLHVDDARLDVDWTERAEDAGLFFQLSKDGRSLFGISTKEYDVLHVYDIEQKTCTTKEMAGCVYDDHEDHLPDEASGSVENLYVRKWQDEEHAPYYAWSTYRCNLPEAKWERLSIDTCDMDPVAPLVDAKSGEDEGFLAVSYEHCEKKYRVDRYLFNTVDSLERLAMDAFRKHNMNVKGDFNFHFFLNETTPGKKILPSLYPNMKPLP